MLGKGRMRRCRTRDRWKLTAPVTHLSELHFSCSLLPQASLEMPRQYNDPVEDTARVTWAAAVPDRGSLPRVGEPAEDSFPQKSGKGRSRFLRRQLAAVPPQPGHEPWWALLSLAASRAARSESSPRSGLSPSPQGPAPRYDAQPPPRRRC